MVEGELLCASKDVLSDDKSLLFVRLLLQGKSRFITTSLGNNRLLFQSSWFTIGGNKMMK